MCARAIWIQLAIARDSEFATMLHQEYKETFPSYRLSPMSHNMSLMIQAVEFQRPSLLKSLSPAFSIAHSTVGSDWVHVLARSWFSTWSTSFQMLVEWIRLKRLFHPQSILICGLPISKQQPELFYRGHWSILHVTWCTMTTRTKHLFEPARKTLCYETLLNIERRAETIRSKVSCLRVIHRHAVSQPSTQETREMIHQLLQSLAQDIESMHTLSTQSREWVKYKLMKRDQTSMFHIILQIRQSIFVWTCTTKIICRWVRQQIHLLFRWIWETVMRPPMRRSSNLLTRHKPLNSSLMSCRRASKMTCLRLYRNWTCISKSWLSIKRILSSHWLHSWV